MNGSKGPKRLKFNETVPIGFTSTSMQPLWPSISRVHCVKLAGYNRYQVTSYTFTWIFFSSSSPLLARASLALCFLTLLATTPAIAGKDQGDFEVLTTV